MIPTDRSSTELQEDPGAYPIPFRTTTGVELGSRLDSIPTSVRYWAVDPQRANAHWYGDMVKANDLYEEWLSTRPPGEYPVPIGQQYNGKRLNEIKDSLRYWGIHPDRSSRPWYRFFVKANQRYEQHLAVTRQPGEFPFPPGIKKDYAGMLIKDIPQDEVWWGLRPSNCHKGWYQPLYHANKRMLDDVYKSRSPGSEPIWFGTRYRGLRLDQVCEREGYMRWCYDSRRKQSGWLLRFKDLVQRLHEWRLVHPERSGPRCRRKAPDIQNPVGEAIGPWDDSPGSADEDDYERGSFIQSDDDEPEYATDSDGPMDDNEENNDFSDADESSASSSSEEMTPSVHPHKRGRTNMILSDDELEDGDLSARKLGRRYRVSHESGEE